MGWTKADSASRTFTPRRIRRIFPALVLVLAAVLHYGAVVLLPGEHALLGRDAAGGTGFVANLVFWTELGYFDRDAAGVSGISCVSGHDGKEGAPPWPDGKTL